MINTRALSLICDSCGSSKIVPIICGLPSSEVKVLDLQEKVRLGGCFDTGPGSPLWECVDCGLPVMDERFLWQDSETFPMRVHQQTIDKLLDSFESISHSDYRLLTGMSFLKNTIRVDFKSNVRQLTLLPLSSGFEILSDTVDGTLRINPNFLGETLFKDMLFFVESNVMPPAGEKSKPETKITVRVDRQERDFLLSAEETLDGTSRAIIIRRSG